LIADFYRRFFMKDMMGMICWCKYVQTIADRYCKRRI